MIGVMLLLDNLVFLVQLNPWHDKGAHTEVKIKLILIKSVKLTEAHVMQMIERLSDPLSSSFHIWWFPFQE